MHHISIEELRRQREKWSGWFKRNARCPICGRNTEEAIDKPAADPSDAALGGRQLICKYDGATLVVQMMD